MVKHISRRSLVKGAAGAGVATASVGALGSASSTFAAPAVIQSGPVELHVLDGLPQRRQWRCPDRPDRGAFTLRRRDIKIVPQALENYEAIAAQLITGLQTGDVPTCRPALRCLVVPVLPLAVDSRT